MSSNHKENFFPFFFFLLYLYEKMYLTQTYLIIISQCM